VFLTSVQLQKIGDTRGIRDPLLYHFLYNEFQEVERIRKRPQEVVTNSKEQKEVAHSCKKL